MSATDAALQRKRKFMALEQQHWHSNEEITNIMKIVHSLKYSCLLIKGFIEKFENKAKEQKGGFLVFCLAH